MFNREFEIIEENAEIIFANALIENLRYGIISLDTLFKGDLTEFFYGEIHTFNFFYMQSALTAQGNIWNMLFNPWGGKYEISKRRVLILRDVFDIDISKYPLLKNKEFRNSNEHFDERYEKLLRQKNGLGDLNVIDKRTDLKIRQQVLSTPHLRTIDTEKWLYITYNRSGKQIVLDLKELRNEMFTLLEELCVHDIRKIDTLRSKKYDYR